MIFWIEELISNIFIALDLLYCTFLKSLTLITLLRVPHLCHFSSTSFVLPIRPIVPVLYKNGESMVTYWWMESSCKNQELDPAPVTNKAQTRQHWITLFDLLYFRWILFTSMQCQEIILSNMAWTCQNTISTLNGTFSVCLQNAI